MKVTSIVCNYNYNDFVLDCIVSLKNQSYSNHICIIDDASTDSSFNTVLSYLSLPLVKETNDYIVHKNNDYTLILLKENKGPSFARNCGILETKDFTDIFNITDADDIAYIKKIEKCIRPFKDPLVGVVYADYDILNLNNNCTIREYKERFDLKRLYQECIVHSGSLIRKTSLDKVFDQYGWYDINMRTCEDYDLWLRIAEHYMIYHVPEALSLVRVHNKSSVHYRSQSEWNSNWERIQNKIKIRNANRNKR